MRNICLIPARSGSKGLKDKNMAYLNSKPVLQHTIEAAINSEIFELKDICVSTDSQDYIDHLDYREINMIYRDPKLASDTATTADVILDFLKEYEGEDVNLILLQPTSPLRTSNHIKEAYDLFLSENRYNTVVSINEVDKSPNLFTELSDNAELKDIVGIDKGYRRQNHKKLYAPNGAIYITKMGDYLSSNSFFTEKTIGYVMDKKSSIDIDDYDDFVKAIGAIFFDYNRREKENYKVYEKRLVENTKIPNTNLLIGDSRTESLDIAGFLNLSMGGVTANTMLSLAKKHIDPTQISKVIINLGVNDIIVGYSQEETKEALKGLVDYFKNSKIYVCNLFPTIYRPNIDNDLIRDINNFIENELGAKIIDTYSKFEVNDKLSFNLTNDGLHLTVEGDKALNKLIEIATENNQ